MDTDLEVLRTIAALVDAGMARPRSKAIAQRLDLTPTVVVASLRRLQSRGLITSLDTATYDSGGVPERIVTNLLPRGRELL